jgi:hypothetical protein
MNSIVKRLLIGIVVFLVFFPVHAQVIPDTLNGRNIYNPHRLKPQDTSAIIQNKPEIQEQIHHDNLNPGISLNRDSIEARERFIKDSIEARQKFIQDSLIAREKFIKDSIQRRQRILDSLNFLQAELPRLFDATLKSETEDIIVYHTDIKITGDSTLSNYSYRILPFGLNKPFTPWVSTINLSNNTVKIGMDKTDRRIISINSPIINCTYNYGNQKNLIVINEKSIIIKNRSGEFFKEPIDSVFFNRYRKITKIKRYVRLSRVSGNYQRGAVLLTYLSQVKQFDYNAVNQISGYQVVNFCERSSVKDPNKVCYIVTYTLATQNKTYVLTRRNDPVNNYSDGSFTFEFDDNNNLKSVSFKNVSNTEDWKTIVELNKDGNVNNYYYQIKGKIDHSLLFKYNLDDPTAKYKVESITCTFQSDGLSYYQKNNTTGKSRVRNKMTLEWSPWE